MVKNSIPEFSQLVQSCHDPYTTPMISWQERKPLLGQLGPQTWATRAPLFVWRSTEADPESETQSGNQATRGEGLSTFLEGMLCFLDRCFLVLIE
jgi:hypothetical protein